MSLTPYYQDDAVTLYLGNCQEVLPTLPRDSVSCILTDPPYGTNYQSGRRRSSLGKIVGDDAIPQEWVAEARRVGKAGSPLFWFVGEWGVGRATAALAAHRFGLYRLLVWNKGGTSMGDDGGFASQTEFIVFAGNGQKKSAVRGPRSGNVLDVPRVDNRRLLHPAEKPVSLLALLLTRSSGFGDTILDPFTGSGSSLVAAKNLGRKAIGIEIEERYCEVAAKRLAQEVLPLEAS